MDDDMKQVPPKAPVETPGVDDREVSDRPYTGADVHLGSLIGKVSDMKTGYLPLPRTIIDSPFWRNSSGQHKAILIAMLCRANWKDSTWWDEETQSHQIIGPGSFVTTYRILADESEASVAAVHGAVKKLASQQFCTVRPHLRYTVITILNWEQYTAPNAGRTQGEREENADGTLPESIKEDKQGSNNQKDTPHTPQGGQGSEDDETTSTATTAPKTPPVPYAEILNAWNMQAIAHGFHQTEKFTDKRKRALKARWKDEYWRGHWREALMLIHKNPWNLGKDPNNETWKATIDWFLRPDTVVKLLERGDDARPKRTGIGALE